MGYYTVNPFAQQQLYPPQIPLSQGLNQSALSQMFQAHLGFYQRLSDTNIWSNERFYQACQRIINELREKNGRNCITEELDEIF